MSRIISDPSSKPNNNRLNRITSIDSTGATVDPLRLVKVNSNPLGRQAEKTLELLEQQSEWKKERWKELSEGLNDQSPNEDWQSSSGVLPVYKPIERNKVNKSLTRWKTRRRSEPLYSQRSLQLSQTSSDVYDETDNNGVQQQSPVTSQTACQTNRLPTAAEVSEPPKAPPRVFIRRAQQSFNDYTQSHRDDTPQDQSVEDAAINGHPMRHGPLSGSEVQMSTRNNITSSTVSPPSGIVTNTNDDSRKIEEEVTPQHCQDKMATVQNFHKTDRGKSLQSENSDNGLTSKTADFEEMSTSNTFQELETFTEQNTSVSDNSSTKMPSLVSNGDRTVENVHLVWNIQNKSVHDDNTDRKDNTVTSANNVSKPILAELRLPSKSPTANKSPASAAATDNDSGDVDVPPPLPSARPPPLHWTMYTSRDRYYDNDEFEDDENFETLPVTSSILSANPTNGRDNLPKIVSTAAVSESDQVLSSSSSSRTRTVPTDASVSKTDQSEMIPNRLGRTLKRLEKSLDSSYEIIIPLRTSTSEQRAMTSATAPGDDVTNRKNHDVNVIDDTQPTDVTTSPTTANTNDQNWSSSRPETAADQLHATSIASKAPPDQLQTTASARTIDGTEVTASNITVAAAGGGHVTSLSSVRRNSGALFRMNASPKPKFIDSTAWIGRQQKTK